jgi:hypothetical protein
LVAVCATLAATASVALAKSSYTVVVTPSSAAAGATQIFNVALTNNTAANGINFAMITPPAGFTLIGATAPVGTIQLQPNKVIIRGLNVAPGATVNVSVTATAPAQDPGSNSWKTQAFSNGPNSAGVFIDDGTSTVTTPVTSPSTTSSDCPNGCTVTLMTPSTTFKLGVDPGSDTTVTASVDTGTPMDGPGSSPSNDPGCAAYTPQSPDWYGFDVGDNTRQKTVTWTVNNTDPNTPFQVCFGALYEFPATGPAAVNGLAPGGTLPDKSVGFVGLLPRCETLEIATTGDVALNNAALSDAATVAFAPLCANITSQLQADGSITTTASVTIPATEGGLPGDPFMGR